MFGIPAELDMQPTAARTVGQQDRISCFHRKQALELRQKTSMHRVGVMGALVLVESQDEP